MLTSGSGTKNTIRSRERSRWPKPPATKGMTTTISGRTCGSFFRPCAPANLFFRTPCSATMQHLPVTWRTSRTSEKALCTGIRFLKPSSLSVERKRTGFDIPGEVQRMMCRRGLFVLLMAVTAATVSVLGQSAKANSSTATTSIKPFLGRWDLTLKTPQREYPSWFEIEQEGRELKATIVSRWGNARPVSRIELSDGRLTFVSPKEEEERKDDMVFEGKLVGDVLVGNTTGQDGTPWQWTGRRAPTLKRNGSRKW